MSKKARSASKARIKDATQAKQATAYSKPANRPKQYYNNHGRLWYGESMFCESATPYQSGNVCVNCGDSAFDFYCVNCR